MASAEQNAAEVRLNRLLNMILESAVEALGFDAASVSARHGNDLATVAVTDQRFIALDNAQYESGEGPCLTVLEPHEPISVHDASTDSRWEGFARAAAEMGVHSTLSMHLSTDVEDLAASLNLYSCRRMQLSEAEVRAAIPFAEQLAAAILSVDAYRSAARLARELAQAMRSRAVIDQATGILMARHGITADAAFALLVRRSQDTNTKLNQIASQLVAEATRSTGA